MSIADSTVNRVGADSARRLARFDRATQIMLFAYIAPVLLLLIVAFVFPLAKFLSLSVYQNGFTLKHYQKLLDSSVYAQILWETLKITSWTTLICLVLGYPVAYALANVGPRLRATMLVFLLVPFWTNVLVRMYAWLVLLGSHGVINSALMKTGIIGAPIPMMFNRFAVILAMAHVMLPYMILPVYSVMNGIPKELRRAALSLGANPYRHFLHVYLPLSLPGVGAGCLLVFILSLGFFITPAVVGGPRDVMLALLIDQQASEALNWPFAAALSVVLMVLTLALYALYAQILNPQKLYELKK